MKEGRAAKASNSRDVQEITTISFPEKIAKNSAFKKETLSGIKRKKKTESFTTFGPEITSRSGISPTQITAVEMVNNDVNHIRVRFPVSRQSIKRNIMHKSCSSL